VKKFSSSHGITILKLFLYFILNFGTCHKSYDVLAMG
jgi:hypothetical protein